MTRNWLLLLQLPLLFIPAIFLGLVTYGSNLKITAGMIYIGMLLGLPIVAAIVLHFRQHTLRPTFELVFLLLAAVVLAWVYRPLHMGFWDEASTPQAASLLAASVLVLITSLIGCARLEQREVTAAPGASLTVALLIIALLWVPALVYPLFPLFSCAAISLLALTLPPVKYEGLRPLPKLEKPAGQGWRKYGLFLVTLEGVLVALDYQGDTRWALHISGGLCAVAVGAWLWCGWFYKAPVKRRGVMSLIIYELAVAAALFACIHPPFVLNVIHTLLIGLAAGWLFGRLVVPPGAPYMPTVILNALYLWVGGFLVAQILYGNLLFVHWRAVLLIPLLVPLYLALKRFRQTRN